MRRVKVGVPRERDTLTSESPGITSSDLLLFVGFPYSVLLRGLRDVVFKI